MTRRFCRMLGAALFSVGIFAASAAPALADITCTEKITALIAHSDGNIFFTTSGTCQTSWCELGWGGNITLLNQAYAMMLASVTTGQPITFDWPSVSTCTSQNAYQASPTYIYIQPVS